MDYSLRPFCAFLHVVVKGYTQWKAIWARLGLGGIRQAVISRRSDTKPEQGGHYGVD